MTVASVRSAMATALRTITGLRASEYLTETVNPPHAMFDYEVEPDMTFGRGGDVYHFSVWVFASRGSDEASQKLLDTYRDPVSTTGVKYVLENNATLAAAVDYVRVTGIGAVEIIPVGAVEYTAVKFQVEVVI